MKLALRAFLAFVVITPCLFIVPFAVSAVELQGLDETAAAAKIPQTAASPTEVIGTVISQVLGFIGILFLILMIWGGLTWMVAGGNEERVKRARQIVVAAVIGLVIVLSAYAITNFVGDQLTGTPT